MLNEELFRSVSDNVFTRAKSLGVDVDILGHHNIDKAFSVRKQKLQQLTLAENCCLALRVVFANHEGISYTESFDKASMDTCLERAITNSKLITLDTEPDLVDSNNEMRNFDFYNPALSEVSNEQKQSISLQLEDLAIKWDPRINNVIQSYYSEVDDAVFIANSRGMYRHYRRNHFGVGCYLTCKADELIIDSYHTYCGNRFDALDLEQIAKEACEKGLIRLDSKSLSSCSLPVVVGPKAMNTLWSGLGEALSQKSFEEHLTPIMADLKTSIASPNLEITDTPLLPQGRYSRPYDSEGTASDPVPLISDGVLQNRLTNSQYAKKYNIRNTGHASRTPQSEMGIESTNLIVKNGDKSQSDLLKSFPKVILVEELYGRPNRVTGDFSEPFKGALYENGERIHGLHDVMLAGNWAEMLFNVEDLANNPLYNRDLKVISPSILFAKGLHVSG
jgi:PmbA protein